jgi:hypothetical protein
LLDGVDEPAKDHFRSGPAAVTFKELLDGNRFLMEGMGGVLKGTNDLVNGMEQDTTSDTARRRALP